MKGAIISHTFANVGQVVVIWLHHAGTIQLFIVSYQPGLSQLMIWGHTGINSAQYSRISRSMWSMSESVNQRHNRMWIAAQSLRKFFRLFRWSKNLLWELPVSIGTSSFAATIGLCMGGGRSHYTPSESPSTTCDIAFCLVASRKKKHICVE